MWCPDWPVVAAARADLVADDEPAAVFRANRVVAASAAARAQGVRRAMRRRDGAIALPRTCRTRRRCEPRCSTLRTGCAGDRRVYAAYRSGASGSLPVSDAWSSCDFGGDAALADALRLALAGIGVEAAIGVADGAFTAALAARAIHDDARIVAPHTSATYLADFPVTALVAIEGGRGLLAPHRLLDEPAVARRERQTPLTLSPSSIWWSCYNGSASPRSVRLLHFPRPMSLPDSARWGSGPGDWPGASMHVRHKLECHHQISSSKPTSTRQLIALTRQRSLRKRWPKNSMPDLSETAWPARG